MQPLSLVEISSDPLRAAIETCENGMLKTCYAALVAAYKEKPNDVQVLKFHGLFYLCCNEAETALRDVESGLKQAPQDPWLLCIKGAALLALGKMEEAAWTFGPISSLVPDKKDLISKIQLDWLAFLERHSNNGEQCGTPASLAPNFLRWSYWFPPPSKDLDPFLDQHDLSVKEALNILQWKIMLNVENA